MKKSIYLLALLAMSIAFVGCDKGKKSGNGQVYAYAPNNCYGGNNGYNGGYGYNNQYNQFNQYNNGYQYNQRYQWNNGQCIDVQDGGAVNQSLCQNVNYSGNQSCTYYGQGNGIYTGNVSGAYNACSIYNTAYEQFYPVYYPNLGTTVCAGYSAYSTFYQYGMPNYYSGYNNVYHGCTMGYATPGCKCKTFGGTLGWMSAGVTMGVCY
ncbi:MAG: hypothetical protein AABZ31_15470 [Bdellovibrionota bacterium]